MDQTGHISSPPRRTARLTTFTCQVNIRFITQVLETELLKCPVPDRCSSPLNTISFRLLLWQAMEPAIKFKKRSGKANLRKRVHRSPPTSSSDSDDSSSPQEDAKLRRISAKRSKTRLSAQEPTATPSHDIFPSPFTADRAVAMTSTNDATNLARAVGPVKKPTNVRTTVTTDFAPDVCKDVSVS